MRTHMLCLPIAESVARGLAPVLALFILTERLVEPLHPGQIQMICCIQASAPGSLAAFYCCQASLALNEEETQTHARQKFHSTVLFKKTPQTFILHAFFFFFKGAGVAGAQTLRSARCILTVPHGLFLMFFRMMAADNNNNSHLCHWTCHAQP